MCKKRLKLGIIICTAVMILAPAGLFARGVSLYLPVNMSPEIERQIERILIIAGKSVLTRPIAVATVLDAIPHAREADKVLCEQVERYLQGYMKKAGLTQLRAEGALTSGDSERVMPNQFGMKVDSFWKVSAQAYYQPSEYALINLGGVAYQGRATPTGSMLSMGIDYAQLDIGYRDHWMSPFTDSSMLISTEAPTMPSITLSNHKPIRILGLSYQVFLAQMSKSNQIVYKDRYTVGNPRLAGLSIETEPVVGYALGFNRLFQYGGGERGRDKFSDFINAMFNPTKYDNRKATQTSEEEFGNQQASLTSRVIFSGKNPFAVYFEYAGEDTSRYQNYLLGNVSFSLGIDFPLLWDRFDLTYESTEWQNGWYVHGIYRDGMINHGGIIGHWFGDQRRFRDHVGGISHMLRLRWKAPDGGYIQGIYRTLKNESYTSVAYERMHEVGLSYSRPWKGHIIGAEFHSGRDAYGDSFARLIASINFAQDWLEISGDNISTAAYTDDSTDLLLDIGMTYSKMKTDHVYTKGVNSPTWTDKGGSAHVGLGARHSVSEHSDLGARIEWERIAGYDLLSARMVDYRYRIGRRFALNGFLGVGRYEIGLPAYGWYLGMGPQLIDVIPKWDLCIDARLHLKMVRDKVLPSDPSDARHPNVYNLITTSVYLSRRF